MNEPGLQFSAESIDQQTERSFGELPTPDGRLIADLYQTYTLSSEEQSRSLQRIWSRFVQAEEYHLSLEDQQLAERTPLLKARKDVNATRPLAPVPGSFQQPRQSLPHERRRSFWSRLSGGLSVAVVLILILSWVLLTHIFPIENPQTTLGASLPLSGAPELNNMAIFLVKGSDSGQYLATISFESYDGHTWSNLAVSGSPLPANHRLASEGSHVHLVTQQITLVSSPRELQPYLVGTGQIASVNQPATALINQTTGSSIAVLLNNSHQLSAGEQYTVQTYVSSADIAALRSIPLPAKAPRLPAKYAGPLPSTYYNPAILRAYLPLPENLDPRILTKTKEVTTGAKSMYDLAKDLEGYLRTNFSYDMSTNLPSGAEAVSWLLFNSGRGFCNYFATAMAIMARELGMPARVVIGYTGGTYDAKAHDWVVHNSDAHAWTQIYFAGYGWINFEPSPGFPPFPGPLMTNSM